jgi:hypothetical protein
MARFFREWRQLFFAPLPWVGGPAVMVKFLSSAAFAALLAWLASFFRDVPGWTLPLAAFVVFYASLTAGMAWDRALTPQVEVSPLLLTKGRWGNASGLFYVLVKNGPVPATVRINVVAAESSGIRHTERPWDGHWRGRGSDFDGSFAAKDQSQYGLVGVASQPSGNPTLFIWSKEGEARGVHPPISLDAPLERQGVTRIDIVVNCETKDGQRGRPQEHSFHIGPDPGSPVGYKVVTEALGVRRAAWTTVNSTLWRYFEKVYTTAERILNGGKNPPQRRLPRPDQREDGG